MKYFIFQIEYSQTDNEMIIVKALNEVEAKNKVKLRCPNARYINYYGETDTLI